MSDFKCISVAQAKQLIADKDPLIVDVRDPQAFADGCIPGAQHLTTSNFPSFRRKYDRAQPVLVCCYHGHASKDMAQMFVDFGFSEVYSMDGGFEAWRLEQQG